MTIWPAILVYGSFLLFLIAAGVGVAYLVKRQRRHQIEEIDGDATALPLSASDSESNSLSS